MKIAIIIIIAALVAGGIGLVIYNKYGKGSSQRTSGGGGFLSGLGLGGSGTTETPQQKQCSNNWLCSLSTIFQSGSSLVKVPDNVTIWGAG